MKTLLSIALLFLIWATALGQEWTWENPRPQGNRLNDASYGAWTVGDGGTILNFTHPVSPPIHAWFTGVARLSSGQMWVSCGLPGGIFHTTDNGRHWTQQYLDSTAYLSDISFVNAQYGWAVGSRTSQTNFLLRTTDGGDTWMESADERFGSGMNVTFFDVQLGWITCVTGCDLLRTTDGGLTWTEEDQGMDKVSFYDMTEGRGVNGSEIWATDDGGQTWTRQAPENDIWLCDISFVNWLLGVAVGENGTIIRTTDGGDNWTTVHTGPSNQYLNAVKLWYGSGDIYGMAAGDAGLLLYTYDGGAHWTQMSHDASDRAGFYGVSFACRNAGWAVGYQGDSRDGYILKFWRSGGVNFQCSHQFTPWTEPFYDVAAVDSLTGYVVGGYGGIFVTTDGGGHWMPQYCGVTWDLNKVRFLDPNLGFALSSIGLLTTNDGGANWTQHAFPHGADDPPLMRDMDFVDAMSGWIIGIGAYDENCGDGFIRHTTDGGDNWTEQYFGEDACLTACSFADAFTGWVVGANGLVLKTTDGGQNWTPQLTGVTWELTAVQFVDPLTGFVLAGGWGAGWCGGAYLYTNDGGETWLIGSMPVSEPLSDLMFTDAANGWAAGGHGAVLSFHAPEMDVSFHAHVVPERFRLSTYPNPFNSSAILEFDLPRGGKVRVSIYNITGQLVETVADRVFPVGQHSLTWNAANLPSGLYLCTLEAEGLLLTRKMVLLK